MKLKGPGPKSTGGRSIHFEISPSKKNPVISNPGIIRVTIYKTIEPDIHLNKPNVTKLRGRSSIFITGFAKKEAIVSPIPVKMSVSIPLSKYNPVAKTLATYKEKVSTVKWRIMRLIDIYSIEVSFCSCQKYYLLGIRLFLRRWWWYLRANLCASFLIL